MLHAWQASKRDAAASLETARSYTTKQSSIACPGFWVFGKIAVLKEKKGGGLLSVLIPQSMWGPPGAPGVGGARAGE